MIPLLTSADVKRAEQAAIETGISESELMLAAGNQIADELDVEAAGLDEVLILCGPGNNGGDGIVIGARLLEFGWNVSLWCWNRERISGAPVGDDVESSLTWIEDLDQLTEALAGADIVVDAVFGAGGRAELPDQVREAFDLVRRENDRRFLEVWAVDFPSGINADTGEAADHALRADVTAMIGLPKVGAFRLPAASLTGRVISIDIGLTAPADVDEQAPWLISSQSVRPLLPQRRTGAHKRNAGTLMVIGGAPNYYGAPRLTGEAALRSGAGLVSIAAPSSIIGPIASAVPELTFVPLPVAEHSTAAGRMASIVRERSADMDALIIGPGLGTDAPVPEFLAQVLGFDQNARSGIGFGSYTDPDPVEPFSGTAVIDADGLNWLSTREDWWTTLANASLVLTPHPGELGRLLGIERSDVEADPWKSTLDAAKKFGQLVVLKYAHSVVASPAGRLHVAEQAPPGLATAGTGDVLAGIIGSFLAQGLDAESAAVAGIGVGLRAAAETSAEFGMIGYSASDIIREIPTARERIIRSDSLYG